MKLYAKPEQALEIQANPRNAKFNAIAKDAIFSLNTDDVSPGGGTKYEHDYVVDLTLTIIGDSKHSNQMSKIQNPVFLTKLFSKTIQVRH